MSDKRLNAIKEIEFRISKVKDICYNANFNGNLAGDIDLIDTLLFDINDFINDLKDE